MSAAEGKDGKDGKEGQEGKEGKDDRSPRFTEAAKKGGRRRGGPKLALQPSLSVDFNCSRIADLLYLGGHELSSSNVMMKNMNISHIVNTCIEHPDHFPGAYSCALLVSAAARRV